MINRLQKNNLENKLNDNKGITKNSVFPLLKLGEGKGEVKNLLTTQYPLLNTNSLRLNMIS